MLPLSFQMGALLLAVRRHRRKSQRTWRRQTGPLQSSRRRRLFFFSVTTGYNYVDFRKFYMAKGQSQEAPNDKAVQLPLTEWHKVPGTMQLGKAIFYSMGLPVVPCFETKNVQPRVCSTMSRMQSVRAYL